MITTHYITMFALFVFAACLGFIVGFVVCDEVKR